MKQIKSHYKINFFKKIFVKICRFFDYEIVDQSNFYIPTLKKSVNEVLHLPGKKSIVLPMGETKITRKVKALTVIFRSCTNVNMLTQNKKRLFDKEKSEYTFRSLNSIIMSLRHAKEYFSNVTGVSSFEEKVIFDIEKALNNGSWIDVSFILTELGRGYFPALENKIIILIKKALGSMSVSQSKDKTLGLSTCYLMQPEALELRKSLIRSKRISVKEVLRDPQCFRYARDTFEKQLSKWSPSNLYFYKDSVSDYIQFLDPVLSAAYVRGFETEYTWKIFIEGDGVGGLLAEGYSLWKKGGNGSVKLNLKKSATRDFKFPEGKILRIEMLAKRTNPYNFKSFKSEKTGARFIVQPWFSYVGPDSPKIHVTFP